MNIIGGESIPRNPSVYMDNNISEGFLPLLGNNSHQSLPIFITILTLLNTDVPGELLVVGWPVVVELSAVIIGD